MQNQNNFLKEKLLNKIKEGKVKMKPKAFFVFKMVFASLGIFFFALFLLGLMSFASFIFKANGFGLFGRFGFWGMQRVFFALPWLIILLCLLLLLIFETIAKKIAFVWKKPLVYSFLVIILLSLLFCFILSGVNLHPRLFFRAQRGELPLMGGLYRNLPCQDPRQIHFGKLLAKTEAGFSLETEAGEILEITLNENTRFKFEEKVEVGEELAFIFEGDNIAVVGEKDDGQIEAFGIIKLPVDFKVPPCGLINLNLRIKTDPPFRP